MAVNHFYEAKTIEIELVKLKRCKATFENQGM